MTKSKSKNPEPEVPFDEDCVTSAEDVEASYEHEEGEKEPEAMTGAMGVAASSPGYESGGIMSSSTTGIYPPFAPTTTGPLTGTGTTWTTTSGTGISKVLHPTAKKVTLVSDSNVELPCKITRKVLIAFIDENEEDEEKNIVWAHHLELQDIDLQVSPYEDSKMTITLSLRDVYGDKD